MHTQIEDFYSTISSNIAEHFSLIDKSQLPSEQNSISVHGIRGKSTIRVIDCALTLEKRYFFKFLPGLPENENLASNLWNDLRKEEHPYHLETRITHFLRLKNQSYDCASISTSDTKIQFVFRISSQTLTQTPVSFKPLHHRLFHLIQEVRQGEFAITHAGSAKPVLATWHLAECVAFAAFNQTYKIAILAHIDPCADIPYFFSQLKARLKPLSKTPLVFDYRLLGGAKQCLAGKHLENILEAAKKASEESIKFEHKGNLSDKVSKFAFELDSWWCPSMRLSRSIALDATAEDPLQKWGSYEPDINPESSLHKRDFSLEEANRFENQRDEERLLKAASCFLPSDAS